MKKNNLYLIGFMGTGKSTIGRIIARNRSEMIFCEMDDMIEKHEGKTISDIFAESGEAYFRQASTTDYNGVYKGYYLDFEAKETRNKTNFPLKNFHDHQIFHLDECLKQQGICFTIIRFASLERYFVTPASFVIHAYREKDKSSMTLKEIESHSYEIKSGFRPTLPYLEAVDKFIADRKSE